MYLIYESYLKYNLWGKWIVFLKNWSEFELTFINKSKGDVRQQVFKCSFCLNYRFFPPGDNFNTRSYSVGYNVIMANSSAYSYIHLSFSKIGPIFLRRFNVFFHVWSHVCKHMFWKKSKQQDLWNRDLQFLGCLGSKGSRKKSSFNLCKFGTLSINMNHNIGFFQWKNAMLQFMFDYMTWIIT